MTRLATFWFMFAVWSQRKVCLCEEHLTVVSIYWTLWVPMYTWRPLHKLYASYRTLGVPAYTWGPLRKLHAIYRTLGVPMYTWRPLHKLYAICRTLGVPAYAWRPLRKMYVVCDLSDTGSPNVHVKATEGFMPSIGPLCSCRSKWTINSIWRMLIKVPSCDSITQTQTSLIV
jgi:hypothetical protein